MYNKNTKKKIVQNKLCFNNTSPKKAIIKKRRKVLPMRTGLISVSFFSPSQERIEINALTKTNIPPKILGKIPKTRKRKQPTVKSRTKSTKSTHNSKMFFFMFFYFYKVYDYILQYEYIYFINNCQEKINFLYKKIKFLLNYNPFFHLSKINIALIVSVVAFFLKSEIISPDCTLV